jgi:hypothetical protein
VDVYNTGDPVLEPRLAMLRGLLLIPTVAALAPAVPAQDAGSSVYKNAVGSVVWIHSIRSDGGKAYGTGSVIDREKRLVVTNYHVVEDEPAARVFFPDSPNGELKAEKQYYIDRANRLAIRGRVVAKNATTDLAIIQIDKVPDGVKAIQLADTSPVPGQSVHSIGNAGKSGALWGYVPGKVRNVYKHKWQAQVGRRTLRFEAQVVETDSATNRGDSGGPLLNDNGKLVGVTEGAAVDAQLVSTFVDVSEVKRLLASADLRLTDDKKDEKKPDPPATAKRDKALPVADKAKLFSEGAVKKAQTQIDELFAKHKIDVLVETHPAVPEADKAKVKGMRNQEQTAYFADWAKARARAERVKGFVVLVSNDPKKFYVLLTEDTVGQFAKDADRKVIGKLMDGLKAGKPDDALADVLTVISESRGKK